MPQSAACCWAGGAATQSLPALTPAARVPRLRRNSGTGIRMAGERPSRARRAMPASRAIAVVTASAMLLAGQPAFAQPKPGGLGLPLIRDAEIEQLMRDYTAPILKVAGLAQQNV